MFFKFKLRMTVKTHLKCFMFMKPENAMFHIPKAHHGLIPQRNKFVPF